MGAVRSIGSITQPAKTSRNKFTEEDDRILLQWVYSHPQKGGGTDGNEIYKQLEAKVSYVLAGCKRAADQAQNARHPWQSWRDRWVKNLKSRPRPAFVATNAPLTPPSDYPPAQSDIEMARGKEKKKAIFTEEDAEALLKAGGDILNIYPDIVDEAWEEWASKSDVSSI